MSWRATCVAPVRTIQVPPLFFPFPKDTKFASAATPLCNFISINLNFSIFRHKEAKIDTKNGSCWGHARLRSGSISLKNLYYACQSYTPLTKIISTFAQARLGPLYIRARTRARVCVCVCVCVCPCVCAYTCVSLTRWVNKYVSLARRVINAHQQVVPHSYQA
jgi:hypothetical protein